MSFDNNKVTDFLERLQSQVPKKRDENKINQRQLNKTYLNFKGNFGRYQILPFDSCVTDYPYASLNDTYEVNVKRRSKAADGEELINDCWLRLFNPNSDAYKMKDMTGRVVSSLTQADLDLIAQARGLFEQLWDEVDGRNNRDEYITSLIRKRNYTVFMGYCMNYWANDSRTPTKQNFASLFVVTSRNFLSVVQENINEKAQMEGGEMSWLANIYNRQLSGRDGFLVFSITNDPNRVGYVCTCNHEWGRSKQLESVVVDEESAELMVDPVASFLGWQAAKPVDGESPVNRRLFNPAVYKEAIQVLSEAIQAIRTAKALGTDLKDAVDSTIAKTLAAQPVRGVGQTNDPILAAQQTAAEFSPNTGANAERIVAQTTPENVTTSPSSATLDPITGMPVQPEGQQPNPFSQPANNPTQGVAPFGGSSPFGGFGAGFGGK